MTPHLYGQLAAVFFGIVMVAGCFLGWGLGDIVFAPSGHPAARRGRRMALIAGPISVVFFVAFAISLHHWTFQ